MFLFRITFSPHFSLSKRPLQDQDNSNRVFPSVVIAAAALGMVSCERASTILEERPLSESEKQFRIDVSDAQRFRESRGEHADDSHGTPGLSFTTPDGWTQKTGAAMRDLDFSFGPNGEGECYLARLPGAGGGLAANVNRWRKQMGVDPLTDEQIQALPTRSLFGQPARFIEAEGSFSPGMGSTETFAGYRLMGLILASDDGAVFVKMTGPGDLVEQNKAAFEQFISSLGVKMP